MTDEAKLYFRDAKYVYPKHKSANGKKDFWARGDGWILQATPKSFKICPKRLNIETNTSTVSKTWLKHWQTPSKKKAIGQEVL